MSFSNQTIEIRGSVYFESKWSLQITGGVLADHVFAGIPFSDEIPGLREEVPALKLTKEIFGLTFVLHGLYVEDRFVFTLEANPGRPIVQQHSAEAKTVDIGMWLAQLVGSVPELRVIGCSPC